MLLNNFPSKTTHQMLATGQNEHMSKITINSENYHQFFQYSVTFPQFPSITAKNLETYTKSFDI